MIITILFVSGLMILSLWSKIIVHCSINIAQQSGLLDCEGATFSDGATTTMTTEMKRSYHRDDSSWRQLRVVPDIDYRTDQLVSLAEGGLQPNHQPRRGSWRGL